jgi:hypothetical protein
MTTGPAPPEDEDDDEDGDGTIMGGQGQVRGWGQHYHMRTGMGTGTGLPHEDRNRDKTTRWDHHTRMRATAQGRGRRQGQDHLRTRPRTEMGPRRHNMRTAGDKTWDDMGIGSGPQRGWGDVRMRMGMRTTTTISPLIHQVISPAQYRSFFMDIACISFNKQ